jgi:hypothetical protein
MSLTAARVNLTHRCVVERDANAGSDDGWGNPLAIHAVLRRRDHLELVCQQAA